MGTNVAEQAREAVQIPEVQGMIKRLSEYGLGVYVPHMYDPATSEIIPLPPNMVKLEEELEVSFVDRSVTEAFDGPAVAWFWDEEMQIVAGCAWCGREGKNCIPCAITGQRCSG